MRIERWSQHLNLQTPAALALKRLAAALPSDRLFRIVVFGSAPLQLEIEPTLLSGDVDIFSDNEDLADYVKKAGLGCENNRPGIEVSSELNFLTSPRWRDRAQSFVFGSCTFILPHPLDVLIAKLNRLEQKDLDAFRVVIDKTGHPTESELIYELQMSVDLFRPAFDEEKSQDIAANCQRLWPIIFGRQIDPRKEIIAPALSKRRAGYGEPTRDYKSNLDNLGH